MGQQIQYTCNLIVKWLAKYNHGGLIAKQLDTYNHGRLGVSELIVYDQTCLYLCDATMVANQLETKIRIEIKKGVDIMCQCKHTERYGWTCSVAM